MPGQADEQTDVRASVLASEISWKEVLRIIQQSFQICLQAMTRPCSEAIGNSGNRNTHSRKGSVLGRSSW